MKRRLTVLMALSLSIAAVVLWMRNHEDGGRLQAIQSRLESRIASGAKSFDFAAETSFAWDRMLVFGPYSNQTTVEKSLGFAWPGFRQTTIESSDSVCLIVFVKDKQVIHWCEQPRAIELGSLTNDTGYQPSEAKFEVDRSGGRIMLRKVVTGGGTTAPAV